MKIIFFGTPDFAVNTLDSLCASPHEVLGVVTNSDREQGRGLKTEFSPVKKYALKNGLKLFQPESLKDESFAESLRELKPDLFVVVAFKILPEAVYKIPSKGAFNIHGSLLPSFRGAAPIQWALIKGLKKTGLTSFFLQSRVDTGEIILQREIDIFPEDDYGTLYERMGFLSRDFVLDTISLIEKGASHGKIQDECQASPAPKISKELCEIDWNRDAKSIHDLIRGLGPRPGAFFRHNGHTYKIFRTEVISDEALTLIPGEILQRKKDALIGTSSGILRILEIQPEGRKKMSITEFLNGHRF